MKDRRRLLVVDDEPLARERLRQLLAEPGNDDVIGEAASGLEALTACATLQPDIVLLDIRMPDMDGLEAARHLAQLPRPPAVIFTTAYDEHALAAFETHAVDYLLKPVRRERLQTALRRARLLTAPGLASLAQVRGNAPRTHFSACSKGSLRLVPLSDVLYLQADQGYVTVRHRQGELLIEDSLRALENEFGADFLRVHRNTLVAVAQVAGLERDADGNFSILLRDRPELLPVSRRLVSDVRRALRR
jgi:two-component system response regulator AlgR